MNNAKTIAKLLKEIEKLKQEIKQIKFRYEIMKGNVFRLHDKVRR